MPKLILASWPLPPLSAFAIGGLITDLARPYTDVVMGDVENVDLEKDCIVSTLDNFTESLANTTQGSVLARISQLLSMSYSGSGTTTSSIMADQSTLYELRNPQARFQRLLTDERTRGWIQEQHFEEGTTIHFVTAFQTATNLRVSKNHDHTKSATAESTMSQEGCIALPACVDFKVHGEQSSSGRDKEASSHSGERVFAFSVQKVIVSPIDKSKFKLERQNMWKVVADSRSAHDEDVADYVEVTLVETDADANNLLHISDGARAAEYCLAEAGS